MFHAAIYDVFCPGNATSLVKSCGLNSPNDAPFWQRPDFPQRPPSLESLALPLSGCGVYMCIPRFVDEISQSSGYKILYFVGGYSMHLHIWGSQVSLVECGCQTPQEYGRSCRSSLQFHGHCKLKVWWNWSRLCFPGDRPSKMHRLRHVYDGDLATLGVLNDPFPR